MRGQHDCVRDNCLSGTTEQKFPETFEIRSSNFRRKLRKPKLTIPNRFSLTLSSQSFSIAICTMMQPLAKRYHHSDIHTIPALFGAAGGSVRFDSPNARDPPLVRLRAFDQRRRYLRHCTILLSNPLQHPVSRRTLRQLRPSIGAESSPRMRLVGS
jgi:hypothetical protein